MTVKKVSIIMLHQPLAPLSLRLESYPTLVIPPLTSSSGPTTQALEIGSGTGLLSLRIAPNVKSLVAVDAASGMIDALKLKLQKPDSPANVLPLNIMLEDADDPALPPADEQDIKSGASRRKFDLILSHLVLHHIPDIPSVLHTMHACLKPGGSVALTDYQDFGPSARKFHSEAKMAGVERHGISLPQMETWLKDAGFTDVKVDVAWKMWKDVERFPGEWGRKKPEGELERTEFPFLLCRGRRP